MPRMQWQPNPAQEEFLRAMTPGARHFFRAGWGTGKTECGAFCAFRLVMSNPGVRGLVVSHTYNHCKNNLVPRIIQFLKMADVFVGHHNTNRIITALVEGIPTEIQWGSADKPKSMDGNDVGWLVGDELRHWPEESYPIFSSRMRDKSARMPAEINLSTPDSNWIRKEFENNPDVIEVVASSYANQANLQPNYIPNLESRLSPGLVRQFVYADWIGAEGAAFPEFDREVHVQNNLIEYSADGYAYVSPCLDFGGKYACVFMQYFDWCPRHQVNGCFHAVDEWMPESMTTEEFATGLWRELAQRQMKPLTCFPDKAGDAVNYQSGRRDIEILQTAGFKCKWTSDPTVISIVNGVDLMRSMLKPAKGRPRMFFDENMLHSQRGIVTAIESAKVIEGTRKYQKDKLYDHALDAWRYGVVNTEAPVYNEWRAY